MYVCPRGCSVPVGDFVRNCVPVDVTIQATSSNVGATVLIVALMGLQCVCGIHALVAHGCP